MNAIESEGSQGYTENQLSKVIFDSALRVHRVLGPGLLESSYEECLFYELLRQDYIYKAGLTYLKLSDCKMVC